MTGTTAYAIECRLVGSDDQRLVQLINDRRALKPNDHDALSTYTDCLDLFKQMYPFSLLKSDWKCIQVGFHDGNISAGWSQPIVIALTVGLTGRVLAIDPTLSNVEALEGFAEKHGVENIDVQKCAVWPNGSDGLFTFFDDFSSTNRITATMADSLAERHKERLFSHSHVEPVAIRRLDEIVSDLSFGIPDFINVTVNGSEREVIESLGDILDEDIVIAFPVANRRTLNSGVFSILKERGFDVFVFDAPPRPMTTSFFSAVASRRMDNAFAMGEEICLGWDGHSVIKTRAV